MKYVFIAFFTVFAFGAFNACDTGAKRGANTVSKTAMSVKVNNDSLEIIAVLRQLYKWHDSVEKKSFEKHDISGLVNYLHTDTLLTGVDTSSFIKNIEGFKKANVFSEIFFEQYKNFWRHLDDKIKHDTTKYLYNDMNFRFEEADQWTGFQDDAGNYWDNFTIHDFNVKNDTASLTWTIHQDSYPYLVKFKLEQDKWRVTYLIGYDWTLGY